MVRVKVVAKVTITVTTLMLRIRILYHTICRQVVWDAFLCRGTVLSGIIRMRG